LRSADGTLADVPRKVSANIVAQLLVSVLAVESAHALVFSEVTACTNQAVFRCCLAVGFFAVSFVGFLPSIGISISFWPAAALRGFLADFFGAVASAAAPPTLRRNASYRWCG
jgi:hypothetical protein